MPHADTFMVGSLTWGQSVVKLKCQVGWLWITLTLRLARVPLSPSGPPPSATVESSMRFSHESGPMTTGNPTPQRMRVLVIEPDAVLRELIGIVLDEAGYIPLLAENTGEALIQARGEPPSLVVTDLIEGPVTVLDLGSIAHLRSGWPQVPFILCTARPGADQLDPAAQDLFAVIPKPFDLHHFVDTIRRAVAQSHPGRQASA